MRVRNEAVNMIVAENAVAFQQLPRITEGLATFDTSVSLGEQCVFILYATLALRLPQSNIVAWQAATLPSMRTRRS
jgi:hypothetical protein